MTRNEALVACGVWLVTLGAGAVEGGTQDDAVIALHGHAITTKRLPCTTGKPTGVLCTGYNTNLPTFTECFVYLTVARADSAAGVAGISLGVDYNQAALGMWGWIQCLDGLAFSTPGPNGDWPSAGSGATITWVACNRDVVPGGGVHAIAGSFDVYAYADDIMQITDNVNLLIDKELRVADCTPTESILKPGAGGSVGFGAQTGTNPCLCAPCVELQVPDTTIVHGLPSNLVPVTVTNCSIEDADLTVNSWIGGQAAPPEVFSAVPPAGVRSFDLAVPCDGDVTVVCEAVATLISDSGCSIADTVSATVSCLGPPITGIEDVGNDQGRIVRLSFARSSRDGPGSPTPVLQYEAYRRIDPLPAAAAGLNPAAIGSAAGTDPRARRPLSDQGVQLAGWDFVDAFPAHGESDYSVLVPTLADSTISDGMHWSVFFVRAATADPYTFFDSSPDSGYSLDNLSPAAPMALLLSPSAMLSWDESAAPDFGFFTVYGSDAETMGPGAAAIGTTTGTDFDVSANPHPFYLVAATDFSGNEGPVRSQASVATTAAGTGIQVQLGPDVQVTFDDVGTAGETRLSPRSSGVPPPVGIQTVPFMPPIYYEITTTAVFVGNVEVCVTYDPAGVQGNEADLLLYHWDETLDPPSWREITGSVDTNAHVICGVAGSLSPFAIMEASSPTGPGPDPVLPVRILLHPAQPNPFRVNTRIQFDLPAAGPVRIRVVDLRGAVIRVLRDAPEEGAGIHAVAWDGTDANGRPVAPGVYFLNLEAGTVSQTRKVILMD